MVQTLKRDLEKEKFDDLKVGLKFTLDYLQWNVAKFKSFKTRGKKYPASNIDEQDQITAKLRSQ